MATYTIRTWIVRTQNGPVTGTTQYYAAFGRVFARLWSSAEPGRGCLFVPARPPAVPADAATADGTESLRREMAWAISGALGPLSAEEEAPILAALV
jgi:hypothetical protein